jgi:hypothetical protein
MAPNISKVDADRHLNPGPSAWDSRDEVLRPVFHGNSLSPIRKTWSSHFSIPILFPRTTAPAFEPTGDSVHRSKFAVSSLQLFCLNILQIFIDEVIAHPVLPRFLHCALYGRLRHWLVPKSPIQAGLLPCPTRRDLRSLRLCLNGSFDEC